MKHSTDQMVTQPNGTDKMDTVNQLIREAEEAKIQAQEEEEQRRREKLEHWRSELAGLLDDELWHALGIDPHTATRPDETARYYEAYGTTSIAEFDDVETRVWINLQHNAGIELPHHVQNSLIVHVDAPTMNRERVAGVLWRFVQRQRAQVEKEIEQEYQARISEARKKIDRAREAGDVAAIATYITQIDDCTDIRAGDRQRLRTRLAGAFWHIRRQRRLHREKLTTAERLIDLATEHVLEWNEYQRLCMDWAASQVSRLENAHAWPWTAYRVRYCARGVPGEGNSPIMEAVAFDRPINDRVLVVDRQAGAMKERFIGAFLDAEPILYDTHDANQAMLYHKTEQAGDFYVNIPPHLVNEIELDEKPEAPASWRARLKDAGLLETADLFNVRTYPDDYRNGYRTPEQLADMTPEELVS